MEQGPALGCKIFYQGSHTLCSRSVVSCYGRIVRGFDTKRIENSRSHTGRLSSYHTRDFFVGDNDEEHSQRAQFQELSTVKDESSVNIMKASSNLGEETDNTELFKRSDFIAKQVISVSEAMTIGYVSQLWVDLRKWQVKAVELKPNLLFGEVEGVFLSDVLKVGDVILVKGEQVLEGDLHLPSFDGVVGCELITEDGVSLGKIRDYVFNVEDGALVYFEYDYLGVSLLPSNMISTYCLMMDEVIEPFSSETLLVRQGAQNRARRLTKGLFHFPGGAKQRRRGSLSRYRRRRVPNDRSEERTTSKTQQTLLSYSPRELDRI